MTISDTTTHDTTRLEFIELVGRIVQADGLPRTAGRLLGFLIFEGAPVAFGDLADRLQVSRGSISSSTRMLEEFGLIRRVTKAGERQDFFELEDDPYSNLLNRARARAQRAKEAVERTAAQIEGEQSDLTSRISELAEFYGQIEICIGQAKHNLKEN